MTAQALADVTKARRIGKDRWQARCPAHADKHPSMTITQGNSGVLIRCWSQGCTVQQIVAALGLRVADLFSNHDMTTEDRAEAERLKGIRDDARAREHAIQHDRSVRVYKLQRLVDSIGSKLASRPDDDEMARLFHLACDRYREAVIAASPCHEDGPLRLEAPTRGSSEMAAVLSEIGRSFDEQLKRRPAETDRHLRIA